MSRLLYMLEDYFDALADRHQGHFAGWVSRRLSGAFAVAGDMVQANIGQANVGFRSHGQALRARGTHPVA